MNISIELVSYKGCSTITSTGNLSYSRLLISDQSLNVETVTIFSNVDFPSLWSNHSTPKDIATILSNNLREKILNGNFTKQLQSISLMLGAGTSSSIATNISVSTLLELSKAPSLSPSNSPTQMNSDFSPFPTKSPSRDFFLTFNAIF
jgi:hypothetical protein